MNVDRQSVYAVNGGYWNTYANDFLGAIALPKLGAFTTDEKHGLFGDVTGKTMLEIGCGDGQSLVYNGLRGAREIWGVDISETQLARARALLNENKLDARLICSPMEEECGVPAEHFDIVYSIYAIGWTTELTDTFKRIARYLKPGGRFIFSWSHPIHKCAAPAGVGYSLNKSYFDESWYSVPLSEGQLTLCDRKISTYVNALADAGFAIEKMVEETDAETLEGVAGDFAEKARFMPVTFSVKARKL